MNTIAILAISFALLSGIVPLGVAAEQPSTPAETKATPEKVETVQPPKDRPDEGVPVPRASVDRPDEGIPVPRDPQDRPDQGVPAPRDLKDRPDEGVPVPRGQKTPR